MGQGHTTTTGHKQHEDEEYLEEDVTSVEGGETTDLEIVFMDSRKSKRQDPQSGDPVQDLADDLERIRRKLNGMKHKVNVIGDSMESLESLSPRSPSGSKSPSSKYVVKQMDYVVNQR